MEIRINEIDYVCYESIDPNYLFGAEEINFELENLRQVLKELDEDIGLKDVSYRLVVYEGNEIDAFVALKDGEYILGVSIGTFTELRSWFKTCFLNNAMYSAFGLNRDNCDYYTQYTYRKALEFLIVHEYTHMKDGHCDIPQNQANLIFEQSKAISKEEALFSQALEFDADNWAASNYVVKIINEEITAEEKNEKLKLLMFSIYTIFKKFSEYENYDFDTFMDDELLKYTHPEAWIRYRYIVTTILTNILDSTQKEKEIIEKDLVSSIINFENDVLNIGNLTEKMYAAAHTLKGTRHLLLLCNSWNKAADKLEQYTHDKLIRVDPMEIDEEKISFIDSNGNVID